MYSASGYHIYNLDMYKANEFTIQSTVLHDVDYAIKNGDIHDMRILERHIDALSDHITVIILRYVNFDRVYNISIKVSRDKDNMVYCCESIKFMLKIEGQYRGKWVSKIDKTIYGTLSEVLVSIGDLVNAYDNGKVLPSIH